MGIVVGQDCKHVLNISDADSDIESGDTPSSKSRTLLAAQYGSKFADC